MIESDGTKSESDAPGPGCCGSKIECRALGSETDRAKSEYGWSIVESGATFTEMMQTIADSCRARVGSGAARSGYCAAEVESYGTKL